jgi:hypothetical protein
MSEIDTSFSLKEAYAGNAQDLTQLLLGQQEDRLMRHAQSPQGTLPHRKDISVPSVITLDAQTGNAVEALRKLVTEAKTPTAYATAMRISRGGPTFSPSVPATIVDTDELAVKIVAYPSAQPTLAELHSFIGSGADARISARHLPDQRWENYLFLRIHRAQPTQSLRKTTAGTRETLGGRTFDATAREFGVACYQNNPATPRRLTRVI